MCGIIGVSGNRVNYLFRANKYLSHRGPDNQDLFLDYDANVGLGHTRLSILDTSSLAHQPMATNSNQKVIVFNGEIYNYRDLRIDLEVKGVDFRSESDTEVLLHLYCFYGESLLSKLNGIFSFAIWDADTQEIFIARDGLGVKPLYYSIDGDCFTFASEIKALLQLIPVNKELDVEAINHYLTFMWCPGEGTPLKSVRKVLPGEAMIVSSGHIERQWLWYQSPVFNRKYRTLSTSDSINGTAHNLRKAVHRQMVSDVPLGAFLSGGLDSSAVVAFACEKNPDIRCFTIDAADGQEDGFADDLPYAKRVAKYLGVSLDIISINSNQMADNFESMVAQLDEPLADPAPLNVIYISKLARKNGIKVLLSGVGGDDLFTGYRRHHAVQLEKYWKWLPQSFKEGLENITKKLNLDKPRWRRVAKLFNGASMSGDESLINYFRWNGDSILQPLYTTEFRDQLNNSAASEPMLDFLKPLSSSVSPLERMLELEKRFFLADHNLIYTDKMSMAAGVEVRVPFLDIELVKFAAQIPIKYKQNGMVGKWVLKKAMEPYLPNDVIYRPKTGFGAPLRRWMKYELRELLGDILSVDSLNQRGIFEAKTVQKLIKNNDLGTIDASYTLLSLMCVEIWCRQFVDGQFDYNKVYGNMSNV